MTGQSPGHAEASGGEAKGKSERDTQPAAGVLPPEILSGFLNGHQFFRILLIGFTATGSLLLRKPYLNLQIPASLVLVVISLFLSEAMFRLSHRPVVRFTMRERAYLGSLITVKMPSPHAEFRQYFSETNLRMPGGFYPRWPFVLDLAALFLLVCGTGGVVSAFFPILPLFGFIGAFLTVGALEARGGMSLGFPTILTVLAAAIVPFVQSRWLAAPHWGALHVVGLYFYGLHIAPTLSFELSGHAFFVRRFVFSIVITGIYLTFTVFMSARAATLFHQAIRTAAGGPEEGGHDIAVKEPRPGWPSAAFLRLFAPLHTIAQQKKGVLRVEQAAGGAVEIAVLEGDGLHHSTTISGDADSAIRAIEELRRSLEP